MFSGKPLLALLGCRTNSTNLRLSSHREPRGGAPNNKAFTVAFRRRFEDRIDRAVAAVGERHSRFYAPGGARPCTSHRGRRWPHTQHRAYAQSDCPLSRNAGRGATQVSRSRSVRWILPTPFGPYTRRLRKFGNRVVRAEIQRHLAPFPRYRMRPTSRCCGTQHSVRIVHPAARRAE